MNSHIDHLVIVADSLEQGSAWCEATLGATPLAGGRHALMGTHNRLLAIGSERFPACYLEIIAIDPAAAAPPRPRWFAMDDPAQRAAARERPRLVHAVARTTKIDMQRRGLINCALNPGTVLAAQRDTPNGHLSWRLTVRDDGRTECGGALPTLIEWLGPHPGDAMPASPVSLRELVLRGLPPQAIDLLRLHAVRTLPAPADAAPLSATLDTPLGVVTLDAWH